GFGEQFFDSLTGPLVGHVQIHHPEYREERSIDLTLDDLGAKLSTVRAQPQVTQAAARIYAPALVALEREGFMGMVVGADPAAEAHEGGLLAQAPADSLGDRRVLVGYGFARQHEIESGMELAIVGQDVDGSIANNLFDVAAVIPSTVDLVHSSGIVMSLADAQEFLRLSDAAHEIIVHVRDREEAAAAAESLRALPELQGAEVLPWRELVSFVIGMLELIDVWGLLVLFIVLIAAAAGIANTLLMSTFERTHEIGMLLALGCGPGRLARMILLEAAFLGQIGVLVGSALGVGLVLVTSQTGLDYAALGGGGTYEVAWQGVIATTKTYPVLEPRDVIVGAVAVLLTSLIASLWPMVHILRLQPVEALQK
ncbi:MAG: FtsX-like permease family protein, partial [Candidatus Eisenbacteria bacterium]|nr:FtsX-like permease family protein [Candidatus Eisenbacteria bacterium]